MKQCLPVFLVCLSLSIFAQNGNLLLMRTNSKKSKTLPVGTMLEIFQHPDSETIPLPHLYFGHLLATTSDSLKIALLEIPRVKTRFSDYNKPLPFSEYPRVQTISLQSIEMLKHTSNFKRSTTGKALRSLSNIGIAYFSLTTIYSLSLLDSRPDLAPSFLLFSSLGLGTSIAINRLCKPKKYKLTNKKKATGWFILTQ